MGALILLGILFMGSLMIFRASLRAKFVEDWFGLKSRASMNLRLIKKKNLEGKFHVKWI